MTPLRLQDAVRHADGWQLNPDVSNIWNWEDTHHVFLLHIESSNPWTHETEVTELHCEGTGIKTWIGLKEPEEIWSEMSALLLLHHNVICEPLGQEQGAKLELPALSLEP